MKTSSKILLLIGSLCIIMQYAAYQGNNFQFPDWHHSENSGLSLTKNIGQIIGYNFFGIVGFLFVLISLFNKKKTN